MANRVRNIVRELEAGDGETPGRVSTFLRGVTMGALVGAAIAGSAIWERAQRRKAGAAALPEVPAPPDETETPAVGGRPVD